MGTEQPLSASAALPLSVRAQGSDRTLPAGPSYTVGRDPQSDIVVSDDRVSWRHAVLRLDGGSWVVEDTGSTNGTFVGSERVNRVAVDGECTVRFGHPVDGPAMTCSTAEPVRPPTVLAAKPVTARSSATGLREPSVIRRLPTKVLRIGRAPDNDVVVSDLSVSRHHAELRRTGNTYEIVDLGSHNGTFVNGQRVESAPLADGDIVGIGPSTFRLAGQELQEFVDTGDISLVAQDLTVTLPHGKVLLDHVSFPLSERCLLGIIGPSGAGKSTLLGALTGMRPANGGSVLYDDRDLYAHYAELRHRIGLVPQENILHTQLTARRALRYAAELRFPRDTSKAERNRRVDEVLAELSLTKHAETRTDRLSGGQQKRVNVALELMTKPSLLFLDEPTSGLDPGLDKSVMEMMCGLAKDGRTVIVVTHSVANLDICDRLLVLVPGGKVAYFGPPHDGLKHFGKPGWAEVFQAFEAEPERDWAGEYRRSVWYQQYVAAASDGRGPVAAPRQIPPPPPSKNRLAQFSTLCRRYLAVIASDRGYLALLIGVPVALGAAVLVIPDKEGLAGSPAPPVNSHAKHAAQQAQHHHAGSHASSRAVAAQPHTHAAAHATAHASAHVTATGHVIGQVAAATPPGTNNSASSLLLILVIGACFMGAFTAVRELVKERAIYGRERAAGLSTASYLGSKIGVLGFITGLQAAVVVGIGLIGRKLPPKGALITSAPLGELIVAIALLAVISMLLGLVISASVNTSEKTMPLLVLLAIVEVLLTGGVFAIAGHAWAPVAWLSPSRWGYAATAATSNLNKLMPPVPGSPADPLWSHTPHTWLTDIGALIVLGLVFTLITWWQLMRQGPARRG